MNIKEIFRIIKFLRKRKTCIVLDDSLELAQFGEYNDTMNRFSNRIMHINLMEQTPKPTEIEEAAALKIHNRALEEGEKYSKSHGQSIMEDVAYGRGYKAGYMLGSREMYDKAEQWLKDRINIDQNVETNEDGEPMARSYIDYAMKRLEAANEIAKQFKQSMIE
jgi:hypothetical protein